MSGLSLNGLDELMANEFRSGLERMASVCRVACEGLGSLGGCLIALRDKMDGTAKEMGTRTVSEGTAGESNYAGGTGAHGVRAHAIENERIDAGQEIQVLEQIEDRKYEIEQEGLLSRFQLRRAVGNLEAAEEERCYGRVEALAERQIETQVKAVNRLKTEQVSAWSSIGNRMSGAFASSFTSILTGTRSVTNKLKSLWNTAASNMINAVLKMTMRFLMGEETKTAAAASGAATREAIQATSETKGLATQAASGLKSIMNDAYKAAAGAYSALAGIPLVGPVLGAAAAVVTFAAVAAFGGSLVSAAGGWGEVPKDQLAMVHKREMVLPAQIADTIRAVTNPVKVMKEALCLTLSSAGTILPGSHSQRFRPAPSHWIFDLPSRWPGGAGLAPWSPSQRDGTGQKELPLQRSEAGQGKLEAVRQDLAEALQAIGLRGIPDDRLTFLRGGSQQGPAYLAAQMGAGGAAAAMMTMMSKNSSSVSSSRMNVYKPTFNFPADLAGAVKRNPDALYKGVAHAMRHGHIRKKR